MISEAESSNQDNKNWSLTTGQLLMQFFSAKLGNTNFQLNDFEIVSYSSGNPAATKPPKKVEIRQEAQYKLRKMHIHRSDLGIKSEWLPENLSSTIQQESEYIERGLLTHALLEEIVYAKDLDRVVHKAVLEGRITKGEEVQWRNHLFGILSHPDIAPFFEENNEVINEQGIIAPGAKVQRPDRIIVSGSHTTIIDYKTGQKRDSYHRQIQAYAELLFQMGFSGIRGYILYTDTPELVNVPLNYQSKLV